MGIWAPNRYEWLVIQYATARIGAVLVTINPALDQFPMTITGKVQKFVMRDMAAAELAGV